MWIPCAVGIQHPLCTDICWTGSTRGTENVLYGRYNVHVYMYVMYMYMYMYIHVFCTQKDGGYNESHHTVHVPL